MLHPAGRPEEGLLLGEACALGCAAPLRLTAAEQALLGDPPPEGLAFFLCLGALPEEPDVYKRQRQNWPGGASPSWPI